MKYIFSTQTTTDGRKLHYLADEDKHGTGDVEVIEEGLPKPYRQTLKEDDEPIINKKCPICGVPYMYESKDCSHHTPY